MVTSATRREHDLWLLENLVPGTAVNNLSVVFEVEGTLSEQVLQRAVHTLVQRHKALQTVFYTDDDGLKKAVRDVEVSIDIRCVEVTTVTEEELRYYIAQPFPLDGGPLLRVALFRGTVADTVCLAAHHLVFDAMSGGTILEELVTAYEADTERAPLSPEPDEAVELPESAPSAESLAFWKRHLNGYRADDLGLWCDKPGEPSVTLAGEVHHHVLSAAADAGVTRLRRELRAPKAVILLTGYYVALALHGAGPDLVVGVPASTRSTANQRTVGYHVNMLPLRASLDPRRSVREVATEVRAGFFEALAHPDVPAETFLPQERGDRPTWRNTLFRHVFNYVPTDFRTTFILDGKPAVQHLVENGTSKYDLEFFLSESAETTLLSVLYNSQVLRHDDVIAFVTRYDKLLAALPGLLDTPVGEIPCWSEQDQLLLPTTAYEPDGGAVSSEPVEVVEAVRCTAEQFPTRLAVRTHEGELSYAELWEAVRVGRMPSGQRIAQAVETLRTLMEKDSGSERNTMLCRVADVAGDLARQVGAEPGTQVQWIGEAETPAAATELFLALVCQGTALGPQAGTAPEVVHGTPAHVRKLLSEGTVPLSGVKAVISGEPLPPALATTLLWQGSEVFSAHRPKGEPHCVTVRQVTAASDATVPGGTPLAGAAPFVSAPDGRRLPSGLRGRLGFMADGVTVMTDEQAIWRVDGTLDILGDTPAAMAQLALLAHPSVTAAAVVSVLAVAGTGRGNDSKQSNDTPFLVAYMTSDGGVQDDADLGDVLRQHCIATLSRSMVPDHFVHVEALPVCSGWIDQDQLVAEAVSSVKESGFDEPDQSGDDALTDSLVRLWSEFLGRSGLDADANFFNEGGYSLLGAQLVQRLKKLTGAVLRLADLFAHPTPRSFGQLLSGPEHRITEPVA